MRASVGTALVVLLVSSSAWGGDAGKATVLTPHDAGPAETTGQKEYRAAYVAKTKKKERVILKGHVWAPDVNALANTHWRRAYSALRIRELAEDDKETAHIARVDAYLVKLDKHFDTELAKLAAEAPAIPPAVTIASPTKGASVAIGTAVTFKVNPVAGATSYWCGVWQPGHNYAWTTEGATPDCTLAANAPQWSKLTAGKAYFAARAFTPAKTKKGVDFKIGTAGISPWHDIMLTGGAAPAASGAK